MKVDLRDLERHRPEGVSRFEFAAAAGLPEALTVRWRVRTCRSCWLDREGFRGAAWLGFLQACQTYAGPAKFTTHVFRRVSGAILDEIRAQDELSPRWAGRRVREARAAGQPIPENLKRPLSLEAQFLALGKLWSTGERPEGYLAQVEQSPSLCAPDPVHTVLARRELAWTRRRIALLSPQQREALREVCETGDDVPTAAARLGLPPGALENRLHRGRRRLREWLALEEAR